LVWLDQHVLSLAFMGCIPGNGLQALPVLLMRHRAGPAPGLLSRMAGRLGLTTIS